MLNMSDIHLLDKCLVHCQAAAIVQLVRAWTAMHKVQGSILSGVSFFLPWAPPWSTDAKFVLVLGTLTHHFALWKFGF